MAIKYCNAILDGKATLEYRKHFVSTLHNAVELFVKQRMLDINDYRVVEIKNGISPDGQPAKSFYNAGDLNTYFGNLDSEKMKPFFSVEFSKIIKYSKDLFKEYFEETGNKSVVCDALKILTNLRNNEMHFYIDKDTFLCEEEFQKLHNFMIDFYKILQHYSLLPYWGDPGRGEFSRINFSNSKLENFTYKNALKKASFVKTLIMEINDNVFPAIEGSAYGIAESIAIVLNEKYGGDNFSDLWTYIEMLIDYGMLTYSDEVEEYDYEDNDNLVHGYNVYRNFFLYI